MIYWLQYLAVRIIAFVLGVLPLTFLLGCARGLGSGIYYFAPKRRKIALDNIEQAFGDTMTEAQKRRIARLSFQSVACALLELFLMKKVAKRAHKIFTLHGNEHLEAATKRGKGAILVISHVGSWEYLAFHPYLMKQTWAVVVRKIKNPYINKYTKKLRLLTTVTPIDKLNSVRPILRRLKKNHVVAVAIDQWAGIEGLWMDFFGTKTSTTSIPARLAKKTGCALIPGYCLRMPNGKYETFIQPALKFDPEDDHWEEATTAQLNRMLEEQIRQYPEQWLWGHRRWKDKTTQIRETKV